MMDDDDDFENYIANADLDCLVNNNSNQIDNKISKQYSIESKCNDECKTYVKTSHNEIVNEKKMRESAETNHVDYKDPSSFPFPFEPYDIQVAFMQNLFTTLQNSKIGIFESPTGTGKSMSLICGSLLWLKELEEKRRKELESLLIEDKKKSTVKKASDDWVGEFVKEQEKKERAYGLKDKAEAVQKREDKLKALRMKDHKSNKKRKRDDLDEQFEELFNKNNHKNNNNKSDDNNNKSDDNNNKSDDKDENLVGEYVSDDEEAYKSDNNDDDNDDVGDEPHTTKIYYCSRTHSQLTQFINEVKKSPHNEVKVTSLGSRMNLCVNSAVKKLSSLSLMNESCRDMANKKNDSKDKLEKQQRKRQKSSSSCRHYKHTLVTQLTDQILSRVMDIEEVVKEAGDGGCPYYASRRAIPASQLVVLPYNTLLHKATREASGIQLKDNVVIIDEGHNLLETLSNIHSVLVTGSQFSSTHILLKGYLERYKTRLSAKNIMYLKQLLFLLKCCIKLITNDSMVKKGMSSGKDATDKTSAASKMSTINNFLFESKLDNVNFFKLKKYCVQSLIAKKLHGFSMHFEFSLKENVSNIPKTLSKIPSSFSSSSSSSPSSSPSSFSSSLHLIETLIEALSTFDKDGRIFITKHEELNECFLKFLLLNPAIKFKDVLRECRSVVITGGTMQPVADFKRQLFQSTGVGDERIHEFSCGHVISRHQLLPISLARGASGDFLDFTYQSRDSTNTLKDLSLSLIHITAIVPAGIVCFLPSYDYKTKVVNFMKQHGYTRRLEETKKIFDEPRKSNQVEKILLEYSSFIKECEGRGDGRDGAILMCVVGGKMSEGINFSDELGRCVIMVGLPYPNIHSPELKEKIEYLNSTMGKSADGRMAGQVHVENLCMKAVNQSIGRAIRHRHDYASIVLLDQRYMKTHVFSKLPTWIGNFLRHEEKLENALKSLREFFQNKKER